MPNRLATEPSPYLRQHADNPVDWYPWGSDALERARAEDRPILLSIGYAACHWCHVMAHESFEDSATARVMNELFVNIKVDREERPDLDGIYMQAVQAMTGQGGWPMTVFLTPHGVPFYGGTYFPKQDRHGLPGFTRVLHAVADAYRNRRDNVEETGARLKEIYDAAQSRAAGGVLSPNVLDRSWRALSTAYDERHGGFGGAPKFPPSMSLDFLLRYWRRGGSDEALRMAHQTFTAMARGGIYDQVGGGLHRYSVDDHWLVPHFEKMLYDNALLVRLGVHLWQATRDPDVRRVVEETLRWLAREMTSPDGGYYSSLDADSEGHEGKFYVWDLAELEHALGSDFEIARLYWGVTPEGNFEGRNILFIPHNAGTVASRLGIPEADVREAIQRARLALYEIRGKRIWPGLDDKIVASWNGLMLRGVAEAARVFGGDEWRELALRNSDFLWRELVQDGRVTRVRRNDGEKRPGFLEDHAALGLAFLDVYALTFEHIWLERAVALAESSVRHFFDRERGIFFDTAEDHEALITRPRDFTDNATPAGQSLAAELVLQVAEYTGNEELRELATQVMGELADTLPRHPSAFGHALGVCDVLVNGSVQVVLAGDLHDSRTGALAGAVADAYIPSLVLAGGSGDALERLAIASGKGSVGDRPTAYVCRRYKCDAPTHHIEELRRQLEEAVIASR